MCMCCQISFLLHRKCCFADTRSQSWISYRRGRASTCIVSSRSLDHLEKLASFRRLRGIPVSLLHEQHTQVVNRCGGPRRTFPTPPPQRDQSSPVLLRLDLFTLLSNGTVPVFSAGDARIRKEDKLKMRLLLYISGGAAKLLLMLFSR